LTFAKTGVADNSPETVPSHRENLGNEATAFAAGCSHRKLSYLLPAAQYFADIVDRLDPL
jgi:hypothetical protein